jgi:2-dehydropantoate 2-reductase
MSTTIARASRRDDAREGDETVSPSRALVVGGGRVGAYLARALRRGGEMETVVMKTSARRAARGDDDETRVAARAVALDAGAIVVSRYDELEEEEATEEGSVGRKHRHFDVVFVCVKTYALSAVKREMDDAGVTFDRVVLAHNGIVDSPFDAMKSTRAVMPQSWDIVKTPGVGCGYDIHVKNEDKPWVLPDTEGGRAAEKTLATCGVASEATDEFEYLLIRKFFINGVANLLAIVGDCNCDGLLRRHRERMETLYDEMVVVLRKPHAAGFARAPDNFRDIVFEGLATYRDHFPSTKLDFDAGARLEIDSLNGYVVRCAEAQGLPCDAHRRLVDEVNALVAARDAASS